MLFDPKSGKQSRLAIKIARVRGRKTMSPALDALARARQKCLQP